MGFSRRKKSYTQIFCGGFISIILTGISMSAFFSDKFDITKHDRYEELSDFDPKNTFDITGYVKGTAKIRKTDEIEIMSRMVY